MDGWVKGKGSKDKERRAGEIRVGARISVNASVAEWGYRARLGVGRRGFPRRPISLFWSAPTRRRRVLGVGWACVVECGG